MWSKENVQTPRIEGPVSLWQEVQTFSNEGCAVRYSLILLQVGNGQIYPTIA